MSFEDDIQYQCFFTDEESKTSAFFSALIPSTHKAILPEFGNLS